MMQQATYAVFLANVRSLRAQVFRSFHSRWGTYFALGVILCVAAAMNIMFYSLFKDIVNPLLSTPTIPTVAASASVSGAQDLLQGIILNFLLTGSVFVTSLCTLMPVKSYIGLAAKVFGARRTAINAGEALSIFVISSISVIGLQAAFFWCLAERSPAAALTMATLILSSVIFTGTTLLVKNIFQVAYERLLKINSELSAMLAVLSTLLLLLAAFANNIYAIFKQSAPLLSHALHCIWLGKALPQSFPAFFVVVAILLTTIFLLIFSYQFQADGSALYSFSRLFAKHAPARVPRNFWNFATRELLLSFRHPTSQTSLVTTLLLTVILAAANRANLLFPTLALYLCIFFCAAGAELSYGRTVTTHWIYKGAHYSITKVLAAKFCAVLITQGGLFLVAVFIALPPWDALAALPRAVPLLFALLCVAFFCGVLIPYSDTVPLSMLGAYALLLLLDAGVFYGEGKLAEYHEIFASLFAMGIGALALLFSILLAAKDTAVAGQGQ